MMASMSTGSPPMWTGMIARVRGVMAASTALGIEVEGLQVDVGEHRRGVGLDDGGGRGQEGVGRHDHLVAGLDAGGHQGDPQRDGAVDHGRWRVWPGGSRRSAARIGRPPSPSSLPHLPLRSARSRACSSSPKIGQAVKGRVRTGVPPRIAKACDMTSISWRTSSSRTGCRCPGFAAPAGNAPETPASAGPTTVGGARCRRGPPAGNAGPPRCG